MRGKRAWVVTDCMNEACGMERKEATGAVRCWGVCLKWKRNEREGFEVRYERSSWNVMGLKECIYRKHMDKSTQNVFLFSAQLMGGGVLLWLLYWRNAQQRTDKV